MAVTNQQVFDFLSATPNMSDAQIFEAMRTFGVPPSQMAAVTGVPVNAIIARIAPLIPQNQAVLLGDTWIQTQYRMDGSGEDQQIGPLEQIFVSKTTGGVNDKQPVGTPVQIYSPTGDLVNTIATKKDQSFFGGLVDALKDPVVLAALGGAAAGGLFGGAGTLGGGAAGTTGLTLAELGGTAGAGALTAAETAALYGTGATTLGTAGVVGSDLAGLSGIPTGTGALTAAETAALSGASTTGLGSTVIGSDLAGLSGIPAGTGALTAAETAALSGTGTTALGTGLGSTVTGMGTGTGLTAGTSGLGLNAAGTSGLGALGTGAGITAGTGLGTGVLTGSTLGTGLLGTTAGLAGLTGTGILAGSGLGTSLLGTTGTGALTGTGILSNSTLGTQLLGTGAGTAATVGGLGNTVANLGTGALTTGLEGLSTGLTGLGTGLTSGLSGLGTGLGSGLSGLGTGLSGLGTSLASGLSGLGSGIGTGLSNAALAQLLSTGLTTGAGLLQQQTSREAALAAQQRIDAETAAAKQAAQFRPIGMTTRFGSSQFQVDPVTGQLTSAGYTLSPEAKAQQDRFIALSNQGLTQAEAAQQQFAPLQAGAQQMFNLGQGYLGGQTDPRLAQIASQYLAQSPESKMLTSLGSRYIAQSPEQVAQNYLNQQMALLQPGRELELANLQNRLQQQGRGGLSVAQGGTMGATTPELQALFNARAQQEAQLAANAQQAGQQQVQFGAGLVGTGQQLGMQGQQFGIDTLARQQALEQQRLALGTSLYGQGAQNLGQYYAGQQAAYAPYTTALGQAQGLETAGQQPFTLSAGLGQTSSAAGGRMGTLGLEGARLSAGLATSQAATNNPYASALSGLGASPAFGQVAGGLLGGGLSGLQSMFSTTGLGSAGFGSGLAYGNQDLGLFL